MPGAPGGRAAAQGGEWASHMVSDPGGDARCPRCRAGRPHAQKTGPQSGVPSSRQGDGPPDAGWVAPPSPPPRRSNGWERPAGRRPLHAPPSPGKRGAAAPCRGAEVTPTRRPSGPRAPHRFARGPPTSTRRPTHSLPKARPRIPYAFQPTRVHPCAQSERRVLPARACRKSTRAFSDQALRASLESPASAGEGLEIRRPRTHEREGVGSCSGHDGV